MYPQRWLNRLVSARSTLIQPGFPHSQRCPWASRWSGTVSTGSPQDNIIQVPESRLRELVRAEIAYLETVPIRAVSIQEVLDCLDPPRIAKFIQADNVKRIAFRIRLIEDIFCWEDVQELAQMHKELTAWYRSLRLVDRKADHGLKEFTKILSKIRKDGRDHVLKAAKGMQQVKSIAGEQYKDESLNKWVDSFLLSRIGSSMLVNQFFACVAVRDGGKGRPSGIVDRHCDPAAICEHAARRVNQLCKNETGVAPPYSVETYRTGKSGPQTGAPSFSYIPSYLMYIMTEILKNSFDATVKSCKANGTNLKDHPVNILISTDDYRIVIRISDRAGGIPFEVGDRVWSYTYGAAASGAQDATPLAGYGVGLPMSRLYARYLGGELELRSLPAFGTDAYLRLSRLEADQIEKLPS